MNLIGRFPLRKVFLTLALISAIGCGVEFKKDSKPDSNENNKNSDQKSKKTSKPSPIKEVVGSDKVKNVTIIDKHLILDSDLNIEADNLIVLSERISTQNFNLNIKANKIIFSDLVIQNFPNRVNTSKTIHGLSGGKIEIESEIIEGNLEVLLTGQDGKVGVEQKPIGESGRGQKGRDGSPGKPLCVNTPDGQICSCHDRVDPEPGHKGRKGLTGNPGGNGGNTGDLYLNIKNAQKLELTYEMTPGKGAIGSLGGEGGPGGKGGTMHIDSYCGGGKVAPNGPKGDRGESGKNGLNGKEGKVCIKLHNFNTKECLQ